MTEIEHVREYPRAEDETPRCAEDCPACLAYAGSDDDRNMPCGESGCLCYGTGEEHADCACGCDCPRDPETGELLDSDDYEPGEYVIVGDE
jgi:hypothetical protein